MNVREDVNPEGLGSLIATLTSAARTVAERLKASGASSRYNKGSYEIEAEQLISFQLGAESRETASLALQLSAGHLVRINLQRHQAKQLLDALALALPEMDEATRPILRQ